MTKEHPDLLVTWNPAHVDDIETSVEIWKENEPCESCLKKGSYVLRDDRNSVGLCEICIRKGNAFTKIEKLQDIHEN